LKKKKENNNFRKPMNQTKKGKLRQMINIENKKGLQKKVITTSLLKNSNKASSKILFLLELDIPFTKKFSKKIQMKQN
jgi:hypothetical protein